MQYLRHTWSPMGDKVSMTHHKQWINNRITHLGTNSHMLELTRPNSAWQYRVPCYNEVYTNRSLEKWVVLINATTYATMHHSPHQFQMIPVANVGLYSLLVNKSCRLDIFTLHYSSYYGATCYIAYIFYILYMLNLWFYCIKLRYTLIFSYPVISTVLLIMCLVLFLKHCKIFNKRPVFTFSKNSYKAKFASYFNWTFKNK